MLWDSIKVILWALKFNVSTYKLRMFSVLNDLYICTFTLSLKCMILFDEPPFNKEMMVIASQSIHLKDHLYKAITAI